MESVLKAGEARIVLLAKHAPVVYRKNIQAVKKLLIGTAADKM
jgi:ribosomal protein L30E